MLIEKKSKLTKQSILFDEEKHLYFNKNKEQFTSVSNLIGQYKNPFDPTGSIAVKCAEKEGVTVEEIKKKWNDTKNQGLERGKSFHADIEHYINTGKILDTPNVHYIKQFADFKLKGKLYSENIVYSDKYKISGTVDLIEVFDKTKINIYDFKTNKKIDTKGFFGKTMKYPLYHLQDCSYEHYTLQLSAYAYMLEDLGYWANTLNILYINPRTNKIDVYKVKFYRKEIQKIFDANINPKKSDPFDW
jgi:hypothetical protein